jgi:Major tropism determinant N-terminal domain
MAAPVIQFKRGLLANLPGLQAGEPGFTTDSYDFYIGLTSEFSTNKFFGSHRYWTKETTSTGSGVNLVEGTSTGTQYITLKSPDTLSGITTYTFPASPTADYYLKTAADGTLSWAAVNQSSFSGIVTFTDTTDNTLGNANTGAIQIDGGLGINKNVTVGGGLSVTENLYVTGVSTFFGAVTFQGGTINLGDSNTDDINVAGEFVSNLVPNTDDTYDIGVSGKRWRNAQFSGIVTAATGAVVDGVQIGINGANVIDTVSGNLTINSAGGQTIIDDLVTIQNNLTVNGNVTVGGTTVTLRGTDVYIENKDIVLGYTTSVTPNDDTANHAGVAIASTVGSPLVSFDASGINTLPNTYKQLMWFKSGTLGFATDAFAFNYGVAIGTTTMANGIRLAVGSGITMTDTEISATTFRGALVGNASSADQVKTQTASNTNATYHITFVDANNGSATNETVYTDDGIYYNPGTNTFTTQHALFTGDVTVNGTLTGTATTATRATTVDTTATSTNANYYVPFVSNRTSQVGETIRVGLGLSVNPANGNVGVSSILSVGNVNEINAYIKAGGGSNALYLFSNGDVSFQAKAVVNEIRSASDANTLITLSGLDATFARDIRVTGITTTGTLKLNGTPGIAITAISSSTTLAENSNAYLPTQAAVKAYVDAVDLTTGIAGDSGTGSVSTSQTLTVAGTTGEIETSASGQTITVGLPNTVIVGTALSSPTVKVATLQHSNGTQAATVDTSGNITASQNLTVSGNLYVNGSTTQVNTASITVEDRTIELGQVDGSAPSSATTWDLGVLFNYNSSGAKKSGVIWEHADGRFKFGSQITDGGGTDNDSPQITVSNYASIEIGALWVNDCAGQSQVISCSGSTRKLENITIDGGTF